MIRRRSSGSDAEVELSVPLATVCYIIQRAHDLHGKTASSLPEEETLPADDPEAEILEDRAGDSAGLELETAISDLPEDAQIDLVALMWLGRDEEDWEHLRKLADQEHTEATAAYLCGTPLLADYLAAGLNALGLDCRDWDVKHL
ncbi:DUF3775 domain-containing protein [Pseudogemmobacter sp. W21_MBD1_M6]|uniref:DUF3775 domain-containing protein n=1 Tax=Pseudogemmobacter sp. W21_MBD1_M6 TaxID=3240271 RepID=UPI003F9E0CDE